MISIFKIPPPEKRWIPHFSKKAFSQYMIRVMDRDRVDFYIAHSSAMWGGVISALASLFYLFLVLKENHFSTASIDVLSLINSCSRFTLLPMALIVFTRALILAFVNIDFKSYVIDWRDAYREGKQPSTMHFSLGWLMFICIFVLLLPRLGMGAFAQHIADYTGLNFSFGYGVFWTLAPLVGFDVFASSGLALIALASLKFLRGR